MLLAQCAADGWSRVALYGAGDLAEIAILSAGEAGIEVVCVIDEEKSGRRLAGRPIVADLEAAQLAAGAGGLDGIIVTDTTAPQLKFDALLASAAAGGFAAGRILAPDLLGISLVPTPQPPSVASEETGRLMISRCAVSVRSEAEEDDPEVGCGSGRTQPSRRIESHGSPELLDAGCAPSPWWHQSETAESRAFSVPDGMFVRGFPVTHRSPGAGVLGEGEFWR